MSWFGHHLNLTAILGILVLFTLVLLSAGIVEWSDSDWLWFDGTVVIATMAIYLLCTWVLEKKGRSLLWLFVVGFLFPVGFIIFLHLDNLNEPSPIVEDDENTLIGSLATGVYHDPLCPQVQFITEEAEIWFSNASKAQVKSYNPCLECNPPVPNASDVESYLTLSREGLTVDEHPIDITQSQHLTTAFRYDCPQCGNKVQDDWKVCPECEEPLFVDYS